MRAIVRAHILDLPKLPSTGFRERVQTPNTLVPAEVAFRELAPSTAGSAYYLFYFVGITPRDLSAETTANEIQAAAVKFLADGTVHDSITVENAVRANTSAPELSLNFGTAMTLDRTGRSTLLSAHGAAAPAEVAPLIWNQAAGWVFSWANDARHLQIGGEAADASKRFSKEMTESATTLGKILLDSVDAVQLLPTTVSAEAS